MWGVVLIFIAVANCNAKCPQTANLPVTASGDNRIIGGSDTTIEKYPYVVQIRVITSETPETYEVVDCGGTLVTKRHVLTAAHCFFYNDKSFVLSPERCLIREGTTYWDEDGALHQVTAIIIHERYNKTIHDNDVAVVLMTTPVDPSVSVARIASIPCQDAVVPDDASVTAVGWGRTIAGVDETSEVLKEVTIRTIDLTICKVRYSYLQNSTGFPFHVTDNMICAGILNFGGKDTCHGDSGGPLIYNGVVVGITSWSYPLCGDPLFQGVYARVSAFSTWIKNTVNDSSLQFQAINGSGNTGSLSNKIGFAAVLAPILYFMLSV